MPEPALKQSSPKPYAQPARPLSISIPTQTELRMQSLSMAKEPLTLDLRNVVNLENAKLIKPSDAYAAGNIKTSITLEQRHFKVGESFLESRRTGSVSKARAGSKYSGISESSKTLGELPAEIQTTIPETRQRAESISSLIQPSRTIETKAKMNGMPELVVPSEANTLLPVQTQNPLQIITPKQITPPLQVQTPLQVTSPLTIQQPAKTYIPATTPIITPVPQLINNPPKPYVPSYTPSPKKVPETFADTPYVPRITPTYTPVPEKPTRKPYIPFAPEGRG